VCDGQGKQQIWEIIEYKILIRKPAGNGTLRGPKRKWEDNIKIYLNKIEWVGVEWIHLGHNRDQFSRQ
jgi:hypothetical protein